MQINNVVPPPLPQRVTAIRNNKFQQNIGQPHIHQQSLSPVQVSQQLVNQNQHQHQHLLQPQNVHTHTIPGQQIVQQGNVVLGSGIPQTNINLFNQNQHNRVRSVSGNLENSVRSISQISVASKHHHHIEPVPFLASNQQHVVQQLSPQVHHAHTVLQDRPQDVSVNLSIREDSNQHSHMIQNSSQQIISDQVYQKTITNQQMFIPVQPVQAVQKMVPVQIKPPEKEVVVEEKQIEKIIEKPVYYEKIIEKEVYVNQGNDEEVQKYIVKIEFLEKDIENLKIKLREHRDTELHLNNDLDVYKQKYQDLLDQPSKVEYIEKIIEKPIEVERYIEIEKSSEQIIHYDHKEEIFQLESDKQKLQEKYDELAQRYTLICAELQNARFSNKQKQYELETKLSQVTQEAQSNRMSPKQKYSDTDYLKLKAQLTQLQAKLDSNSQTNTIQFRTSVNQDEGENERHKRAKKVVVHQHEPVQTSVNTVNVEHHEHQPIVTSINHQHQVQNHEHQPVVTSINHQHQVQNYDHQHQPQVSTINHQHQVQQNHEHYQKQVLSSTNGHQHQVQYQVSTSQNHQHVDAPQHHLHHDEQQLISKYSQGYENVQYVRQSSNNTTSNNYQHQHVQQVYQ